MSNEIELKIEATNVGAKQEEKYKEWEIEDAVRTIVRAEEIKQDPELMALVAPKLKQKAEAAINAANILYCKKEGKENEN